MPRQALVRRRRHPANFYGALASGVRAAYDNRRVLYNGGRSIGKYLAGRSKHVQRSYGKRRKYSQRGYHSGELMGRDSHQTQSSTRVKGRAMRKKYKRVVSKACQGITCTYYTNDSGHIENSNTGSQYMKTYKNNFDVTENSLISNEVQKYYESPVGGFQLGSFLNETPYFVKSYTVTMTIVNNNNYGCYLTLYDLACKVDGSVPLTPEALVDAGLKNSSLANSSGVSTYPEIKPTLSYEFNRYWKVKRRKTVYMSAASTHKHVMSVQVNRKFTRDELSDFSVFRGSTTATLLVARGDIIHTAGHAVVTTGQLSFDIVREVVYKWSPMMFMTNGIAANQNLNTTIGYASALAEHPETEAVGVGISGT
jgi:hypothetical protein